MLLIVAGLPSHILAGEELRVMSFNIRYGKADDGANAWDRRKELLLATIQSFAPDILGTQETLAAQRDFLAQELPEMEAWGVGRDDGVEAGEMTAIFFRRQRFERLDGGHFWLSPQPEQVGVAGWDAALPRMVSWLKLKDLRTPGAQPILVLNTHFDHQGQTARLESARLISRRIADLGDGCALILTGDFNSAEGSPPYGALFHGSDQENRLVDSFRVKHPVMATGEGTFNGFRATAIDGPRIDWIGVSRDWQVNEAAVDHMEKEGQTPSDHFPVTAVISR